MRITVGQFNRLTEEKLLFAKQMGATGIQLNTPDLPGTTHWEYEDLIQLREQCEKHGLRLEAIENVPLRFYDKIMLGTVGKEEQLAYYKKTIRNMGKAGIPILGYHFMPNGVWRTSFRTPGRGGAHVSSFDMKLVENLAPGSELDRNAKENEYIAYILSLKQEENITEQQMWDNHNEFLREVIPIAEISGVKLALHPDDPPVPVLGNISRLFYKKENFIKAMEIANSDYWGLDLCLGCCSEMGQGADNVMEMIEYFGPLGKIFYVHFRDVQGTVPIFQECFLGEGNYHPFQALMALQKAGFDGFLLDDHVPSIIDDTNWGHRSRAHEIGYLQGMLNALEWI